MELVESLIRFYRLYDIVGFDELIDSFTALCDMFFGGT